MFKIGSKIDPDYEKNYHGNLNPDTKEKCREYSKMHFSFKTFPFDKDKVKADYRQKIAAIFSSFEHSGQNFLELKEFLEFLIMNKGNIEFMMPYYHLQKQQNFEVPYNIEVHHNTTHFILGTVDKFLKEIE